MTDSYRTPAELAELDEIVAEISRERAAAPGLAARYDAACERIIELHEETTRQRERIWDLEERLRNAEDCRSPRTSVDFLDDPVLPHRSPGSVKTFREMLTEALDTAQAGDRDGAEHLLNEMIGHLGRLQRRPRETTVSNDMLYAITQWLDSVTDLHEQQATGPGCQWCNDEDWPCADTRHAQAVARTMPTTHTEASDE